MINKLCGDIAQIIYELAECGVCPDMRRVICNKSKLPFYIMTHTDKERAVLIGLMTDPEDELYVKAYKIDFHKWNWAAVEGFNLDDIFTNDLHREIFKDVEAHQISSYFIKGT
tara:strand:- start:5474 stop:5812 length:339 start_codon:yes stop_codon:yes gene_type:complete